MKSPITHVEWFTGYLFSYYISIGVHVIAAVLAIAKVFSVIVFIKSVNGLIGLFQLIWGIMGLVAYFNPGKRYNISSDSFECVGYDKDNVDTHEDMTLCWVILNLIAFGCCGLSCICLPILMATGAVSKEKF